MPYSPTAWVDGGAPSVSAANLNNIENALTTLYGVTPATNGVMVWDGTQFTAANLLKNAQVDAAAAIAYSKLNLTGSILNADLAGSIALSKLALSGSTTKFVRADGTEATPPGVTTYRKTTAKTVNTTTTATDLLNGEITIAANAVGATGHLRLTAFGDYLQNSGGATNTWRFQLLLGATTIFDTGSVASGLTSNATRWPWKIVAEIQNTATNAQVSHITIDVTFGSTCTSGTATFTTGEGRYGPETANAKQIGGSGYNTSAVDTTSAQALVLNVINPSASASCETKLTSALIEVV